MVKTNDELYKDEGIAIFIKGVMVIGIHPDNVENNVKALENGTMKIGWEYLLKCVNYMEKKGDELDNVSNENV